MPHEAIGSTDIRHHRYPGPAHRYRKLQTQLMIVLLSGSTDETSRLLPFLSSPSYCSVERLPSSGVPSALSTTLPCPTRSQLGQGCRVRRLPVLGKALSVRTQKRGRYKRY